MTNKTRRCGNCGAMTMKYRHSTGPFPWRDFKSVTLAQPIEVLTCAKCGETGGIPGDSQKLDQAVEATLTFETQRFIEKIIAREDCRQIDLAGILGVTPDIFQR